MRRPVVGCGVRAARARLRRRALLLLVPVVLGATGTLASPAPAAAATGATRTGVTTYVVNPEKNEIDVTVTYTIKNTTKSKVSSSDCYTYFICTQTTNYYFDDVYLLVDEAAGPISATSNAGKVTQVAYAQAPSGSRAVQVKYPPVWFGQTRVVTATYAIPAGIKSSSFRALKSYASLCAVGNVWMTLDSKSVQIVLPEGFVVLNTGSFDKPAQGTGPVKLSSTDIGFDNPGCIEAVNPAGLASSTATGSKTSFTIKSWPEDTAWKTRISGYVTNDVPKIEDLVGVPLSAGPFTLAEAPDVEVGGSYDTDKNPIRRLGTETTEAEVVGAIGTQGYAARFDQTWMSAGLAGYAEQLTGAGAMTCTEPGKQQLVTWATVRVGNPSDKVAAIAQFRAACSVFKAWATAVGATRLKDALVAAYHGENPYDEPAAAGAAGSGVSAPITAQLLLDMVDERAMVPAGVKNLDQAQNVLADSGVFPAARLQARSAARAQYHALIETAGTWKLPASIRKPMAAWDFDTATALMNSASKVLEARDQLQSSGLKVDGTKVQQQFESAATSADLDAALALEKRESDAAAKVAEAEKAKSADRSFFQSVGLMDTDLVTPMDRAHAALKDIDPENATTSAQTVMDAIARSGDAGFTKVAQVAAATVAVLLLLLSLIVFFFWRRRRGRRLAMATAAALTPTGAIAPQAPPAPGWGLGAAPPVPWPGMFEPYGAQPAPPETVAGVAGLEAAGVAIPPESVSLEAPGWPTGPIEPSGPSTATADPAGEGPITRPD